MKHHRLAKLSRYLDLSEPRIRQRYSAPKVRQAARSAIGERQAFWIPRRQCCPTHVGRRGAGRSAEGLRQDGPISAAIGHRPGRIGKPRGRQASG